MDLTDAKRLAFDIASERSATLLVSLELSQPGASQGPRYKFVIYPPKDREVFHVNVPLSAFEYDESSPADAAGKLNPGRIKTIMITDLTGIEGGGTETGANRIWIGNLRVTK